MMVKVMKLFVFIVMFVKLHDCFKLCLLNQQKWLYLLFVKPQVLG
jgi:hypothetical protein